MAAQDAGPVLLGNHDITVGGCGTEGGDVAEIPDVPAEALIFVCGRAQPADRAFAGNDSMKAVSVSRELTTDRRSMPIAATTSSRSSTHVGRPCRDVTRSRRRTAGR